METADQSDPFRLEEHAEEDALRLVLIGELDLAAVPALDAHLRRLRDDDRTIHLDLSRLRFIDSTGLRELVTAVSESRRDGRRLVVDGTLTRQVSRLIELSGAGSLLWPEQRGGGAG